MATYESVGTSTTIAQGATSVVITKPSGVAVGDVLIAGLFSYAISDPAGSITPPAGWTLITSTTSQNIICSTYSRVAEAADVSASDYTFTTSKSSQFGGIIVRASSFGIVAGSAFGAASATSSSTTFSGFTPTRANTLLIFFGGTGVQSTQTGFNITGVSIATSNPTWTSRAEIDLDVTNQTHAFAVYTATRPEITATGNATFNFSDPGVSKQSIGIILAISPQVNSSITPTTQVNAYALSPISPTRIDAIVDEPTTNSMVTPNWQNATKPTSTWRNPNK